jgi:hypothetical protein
MLRRRLKLNIPSLGSDIVVMCWLNGVEGVVGGERRLNGEAEGNACAKGGRHLGHTGEEVDVAL